MKNDSDEFNGAWNIYYSMQNYEKILLAILVDEYILSTMKKGNEEINNNVTCIK